MLLNSVWPDLKYGLRILLKNPGFAIVAVVTLAIGIGANTAIFSMVQNVLLKPLAFAEQEQLVVAWKQEVLGNNPVVELSVPEFYDWRNQSEVFQDLAAMPTTVYGYSYTLTGWGEPLQIESARVSANFFSVLGSWPMHGRLFAEEEDRPGANPVVMLNYHFWMERFNSDPNLVGKTITLNGVGYTVIGIMPPEFSFPKGVHVWVPLSTNQRWVQNRLAIFLQVVGRLKPGVTSDQASAELNTIISRVATDHPETDATGQRVVIKPLAEHIFGNARIALYLLLAATCLLLLIACTNIANLLLARTTARMRESAVRSALGASRGRLTQQFLCESLVIAIIGGALGIFLARVVLALLVSVAPADIPRVDEIHINVYALLFTLGVTLLSTVVFGLVPALAGSNINLSESLKEGGPKTSGNRQGRRLRGAFIVAQVAITVLLLIATALIVRTFVNLQQAPLGFDPQNLLTVQVSLTGTKYTQLPARRDFFKLFLERLEAQPNIEAVGAILMRPLEGSVGWNVPFIIEGQLLDEARRNPVPNYESVTPHYFRATNIPLLAGRDFTEQDTDETTPVIIISDSLAKRLYPDTDPIGKRIKLDPTDPDTPWQVIVGVAGDVRYRELSDYQVDVYVPYRQSSAPIRYIMVRTTAAPVTMIPVVRRELAAIDPDQALGGVATMDQLIYRALARPRFNTLMLGFLGLLSAALALIGIYGVVSYSVAQRTREIGIRVALGANAMSVRKLIVGEAMKLVVLGTVLGLAAALATTRLMATLLYNVSVTDLITFTGVPLLLVVAALIACLVPAHKALRVNPIIALRYE